MLSDPACGIVSLIASRHVTVAAGPRRDDLKSAKHRTKFARQMDNLETSGRPNESTDATAKSRRRCNLFTKAGALWKVDPPLIVFIVRLILIYSDRLHNGAAHLGPQPPSPPSAGSFCGPSLYFLNTLKIPSSLWDFCACRPHMVTDYMGIRNESFMKMAAVGTWMGDFVTAWMVRLFIFIYLLPLQHV